MGLWDKSEHRRSCRFFITTYSHGNGLAEYGLGRKEENK